MAPTKRSAKAEYWQRMVNRFTASGLSVSDFCSRHQISAHSLYQWRRKLKPHQATTASGAARPELLPVRIVPATHPPVTQSFREADRDHVQIVTPSGFVVRVSSAEPASLVAKLLGEIESVYREGR